MKKIAGVVVTYNRKNELIKNLEMLNLQRRRADAVYIVDNCSNDGTEELLASKGFLENKRIVYVKLKENTGGAGGFYSGLKRAYDDGFDYIILMDDDGRPANNMTFEALENMANKLYNQNRKIMINSVVVCDESQSSLSFEMGDMKSINNVKENSVEGALYDYINPFNGTLVSKELVEEIGYPNKDFFIRGDEVDYQNRARKFGATIATVVDSIYFHPAAEKVPIKWRGRLVNIEVCSPWKSYYLMRNYIYRIKRDEGLLKAIKEAIFQRYCTLHASVDGKKNLPLMRKGFIDGMLGKLGKRVNPGQTK